jgi:hypothetical protein
MSEPIDLAARRQEKAKYIVCQSCPSAYFRVENVTFGLELDPEGFGGIPCCVNCGALYTVGVPEGVAMPCGNCHVPLVLPGDADHRCPGGVA